MLGVKVFGDYIFFNNGKFDIKYVPLKWVFNGLLF